MKNSKFPNWLTLILAAICFCPLLALTTPLSEQSRVQLDQTMSVEFPSQPSEQDANGIKLYVSRSQEAVYMAFFMDHTVQPGQEPIKDKYAFYLGMMDSMIRNAKATLTDSSSFNLGTHKGIEFSYTTVQQDGAKVKRSNRLLFINGRVYNLGHTSLAQPVGTSEAPLRKFLNSMKLTSN
ncbi:hypothetical protein [Rufibacter latericius]|uniref:DUF1795 domain-containing protein n=1 Tax=Rufibacter latericius TaxID=2487040 RepID=A0A3M9N198_9BACT|nr:hypothetical protein [Rufibacter latericius]RNI31574.1 hypothetical protein EFB08_03390 [Rufibacter latericius]